MSKFSKFVKFYKCTACRRPILTQSIQTGILMASGDVIAQKLLEKRCDYDYLRTAQFFTLGAVLVGPAVTTWYKFLSRIVDRGDKFAAVKKMALDQLIFAPSFLAFFVCAINLIQGKDLKSIKEELKCKYKHILITNYKVWPMVQLVNFYMVPLMFQVLFTQVVALFWNAFLSWKTQQEVTSD